MNINILAGGPAELLPDLTLYDNEDTIWIGVDRGVYTLISKGIHPTYAFGDFDSVTKAQLQKIEKTVSSIEKFKPEKDETDLELALNWALDQQPTKIHIFGGTGGRLDHLFANVYLLLKPTIDNKQIDIEMIDQKNILFLKTPGTYTMVENSKKKYISFVPITGAIEKLTLKGFKYPLVNRHIPMGSTLCISNELINKQGTFSFSNGILLVIRSSD